jgi:hypothetical protein
VARMLIFGSLVATLAFFAYRLTSPPYEEFNCSEADRLSPNPPAECFLPENYRQSKEQFRTLAKVLTFCYL